MIFFLQKRLCYDDPESTVGEIENIERDIDENVIIDPSEVRSTTGGRIIQTICKAKNHFMTNLGIAFLILTVVR